LFLLTNNKYNYYGIKYFHAHRIEPTDSLYFAGELVHISNKNVKEKIEKELYLLTYYRSSTRRLLRKMDYWLPSFEPVLKRYNIPQDFKYLVVIESNLTNAISNKAAVGFWQFTKATALENQLIITNQLDQRYDPLTSSAAASKYLKRMYRRLGSWSNVAASYNMGINGFIRQQKIQRKESYFDLILNKETGRYVYKMIALKIIDDNRKAYRFRNYPRGHKSLFEETIVDSSIINVADFAHRRGISTDSFKVINPWLLSDMIDKQSKKYRILAPKLQPPITEKQTGYLLPKDTVVATKFDTLITD
jgi:membrane-bound lytic murein transglycosylase D